MTALISLAAAPLDSSGISRRSLSLLVDALHDIGRDLDVGAMLRRIAAAALSLVEARAGSLSVVAGDHDHAGEHVVAGEEQRLGGLLSDLSQDGEALDDGAVAKGPVRVDAVPSRDDASEIRGSDRAEAVSVLGVPLVVDGVPFALLRLAGPRHGGAFTEIDQAIAVALLAGAGVTLRNARDAELDRRRQVALQAAVTWTNAVIRWEPVLGGKALQGEPSTERDARGDPSP